MHIDTWFVRYGEAAQYVAYAATLAALRLFELRGRPPRPPTRTGSRWRVNFLLTGLNILVLGALPLSFITAAQWGERHSHGLLRAIELPLAAELVLGLLGRGFISWITHLLMHKVPVLWRVHRVHHTDTELDVSSTVRFHPLEFPITLMIGLPLVLTLGIDPWVLLAYEILDAAITVFSHADIELPEPIERLLRYVIVTPGLHRVHHSSLPVETDSNFSAVFPIWDLLFGTFRTAGTAELRRMQLGLSEVRDERALSLAWLLRAPFLAALDAKLPSRSSQPTLLARSE